MKKLNKTEIQKYESLWKYEEKNWNEKVDIASRIDIRDFLSYDSEFGGFKDSPNWKGSYQCFNRESLGVKEINGKWYFYWFSYGKGGGIIDFCNFWYGMDFIEAVVFLNLWLEQDEENKIIEIEGFDPDSEEEKRNKANVNKNNSRYVYEDGRKYKLIKEINPYTQFETTKKIDVTDYSPKQLFDLETKDISFTKEMKSTFAYLETTRNLNHDLVQYLVENNYIKTSTNAKSKNTCFIFKDFQGEEVGISMSGNMKFNDKPRFKKIVAGSCNEFGFNFRYCNKEDVMNVHFFESPEDMLAYITIFPQKIFYSHFVAMCGLKWEVVSKYIEYYGEDITYYINTDNDKQGKRFANNAVSKYSKNNIVPETHLNYVNGINLEDEEYKDFSDLLNILVKKYRFKNNYKLDLSGH